MPAKKQTKGTCSYCGKDMAKTGMLKHLPTCVARQAQLAKIAGKTTKEKPQTLYHLRVQNAWIKDFWLDLEMNGNDTFVELDDYLRAIWLECCGHLSQFSIGDPYGSGNQVGIKKTVKDVFEVGLQLTHIYDFGSTTETLIKVISERTGIPTTKHPIVLMARNLMPEAECIECGKPARWFCMECQIEDDVEGFLCDAHYKKHPHDNYGEPVPLVNSPRMGVCGYDGPAKPPY